MVYCASRSSSKHSLSLQRSKNFMLCRGRELLIAHSGQSLPTMAQQILKEFNSSGSSLPTWAISFYVTTRSSLP
jgi:hypothetical protein